MCESRINALPYPFGSNRAESVPRARACVLYSTVPVEQQQHRYSTGKKTPGRAGTHTGQYRYSTVTERIRAGLVVRFHDP